MMMMMMMMMMMPIFVLFQARFLLFKVNPTMTHNNMYAWGGVSIRVYSYFLNHNTHHALPNIYNINSLTVISKMESSS